MACLTATTWAWFTVDITNRGNEINTAKVEVEIALTKDGERMSAEDEVYTLSPGTYTVTVDVEAEPLQNPVYVLMSIPRDNLTYCFLFQGSGEETGAFTLEQETKVNFQITWIQPDGAVPFPNEEDVNEPTTAPTTEPATEPSTEPATEPEETTPETTTPVTETEETTPATEATEATEEATEATESATEATEAIEELVEPITEE